MVEQSQGRVQPESNGFLDYGVTKPGTVCSAQTVSHWLTSLLVCGFLGLPVDKHSLTQDRVKTAAQRKFHRKVLGRTSEFIGIAYSSMDVGSVTGLWVTQRHLHHQKPLQHWRWLLTVVLPSSPQLADSSIKKSCFPQQLFAAYPASGLRLAESHI